MQLDVHSPRTEKVEAFGGIIINGNVNSPRVSMPASFLGTVLVYMRLNPDLSMMSGGGEGHVQNSSSNQDLTSELSSSSLLVSSPGLS